MTLQCLSLLCSIHFLPLEYHPFLDTYNSLGHRAWQPHEARAYRGQANEICDALNDELVRVYEKIQEELKWDKKTLLNALNEDGIAINDQLVEKIYAFRMNEAQRLKNEQDAWEKAVGSYSLSVYYSYIASGGHGGPVALLVTDSRHTHERIRDLKQHYQAVFTKDIQPKHLWGKWKSEDQTEEVWFQRTRMQSPVGNFLFRNKEGYTEKHGNYELAKGRLTCEGYVERRWINIVEKEDDSLHLQFCETGQKTPIDTWLNKQVEESLMQELKKVYHILAQEAKEWEEEHYQRDENKDETRTTFYVNNVKEAQEAWLNWFAVAYDSKNQMFANGTTQSLRHCQEKNRQINDLIQEIQSSFFIQVPVAKRGADLIVSEGSMQWISEKKGEVWNLTKESDQLYTYSIAKGDEILEEGEFDFVKGNLILRPKGKSKRENLTTPKIVEEEKLLGFRYLMTPLKVQKSFLKLFEPL